MESGSVQPRWQHAPNGTASARFDSWTWPISQHQGIFRSVGRFGGGARRQRAAQYRGLMMKLKKIATDATIAGALAFTAFGLGAGVANADPASPRPAVMTSKLDGFALDDWGGPGPGWGYGGGGPGYGYGGGPGYGYGGACAWVPPVVSVWIPPAVCGG